MPKRLYSLLPALLLTLPLCGDSVLYRAKVPNTLFPQGEVQLVARGEEAVVRSVIRTRFPEKVLTKIVRSEQTNWPDHAETKIYIAALQELFACYAEHGTDEALTIDFTAGPGGTRVDLFYPAATLWRSLPLSRDYVCRNQEYIIADSFGKQAENVIAALEKLNPRNTGHAD